MSAGLGTAWGTTVMMAKHNLILVLGAVAAAVIGCAQIEPSVNAGVDATKTGIERADAFLSNLVGVEKAPKALTPNAQESAVPVETKVN